MVNTRNQAFSLGSQKKENASNGSKRRKKKFVNFGPSWTVPVPGVLEVRRLLSDKVSAVGAIVISIKARFDAERNPSEREEENAYYESTAPSETSGLSSDFRVDANGLAVGTVDADGILMMLNITGIIDNVARSFRCDTHNDDINVASYGSGKERQDNEQRGYGSCC